MHSPQGLAGNRDEQPVLGTAGHLRKRMLGVGQVLEHLDRAGNVELVIG